MKIAICFKAIQQRDGTCQFAMQLGEVLAHAGHQVTMMASIIRSTEITENTPQLTYVSLQQFRMESKVAHVRRIGSILSEQSFQVIFICLGLPVPNLEYALRLVPDSTAIVPILGGDREHVYQFMKNTLDLWNLAVAESPRLEQQVNLQMPQKPTQLLITGISQPLVSELSARIAASTPLRIFYVGRLVGRGRKNVLLLPKILASCVARGLQVTLSICGKGIDQQKLAQAIDEEGVSHLVEFKEIPLRVDLYEAYRNHHILLWTSDYGEGLGLVLMEAQANGCVPVASRLIGVTDFTIGDESSGLLAEIGDIKEFTDQIERLADPITWQQFSTAAIARTQMKFSFAEMEREYEALLNKLVNGQFPLPRSRSLIPAARFMLKDYMPSQFRSIIHRFVQFFFRLKAKLL